MAQSLTVTVKNGDQTLDCYAGGILNHAIPITIELDWQSDGDGAVNYNIAATLAAAMVGNMPKPTKLRGYLARVVTVPDADTTQPTAAYDLYLKDPNGIDIGVANLDDRSNTAAEQYVPTTPIWIDHEVNLVIAAAGATKGGKVILYMVP